MNDRQAARGLGIASLVIGLTEICAPRKLERAMGISNGQNTGILRVLGVREILTGVDILAHEDPTLGIWGRVLGDLLDGVLLTIVGTKTRRPGGFLAVCAMVLPIVVADMLLAPKLSARHTGRSIPDWIRSELGI